MEFFARFDEAQKSSRRIIAAVLGLGLVALMATPAFALFGKKKDTAKVLSSDLSGSQPYPHHWFEAKDKKKTAVFGQVYKARPDLAVFEMFPPEEAGSEIKAVRIKDKHGKVYEARIRRLPAGFMPTARRNYQQIPQDPKSEVRL